MRWLTNSLLILLSSWFAGVTHAQQILQMRDGETQSARISQREVSRIAVEGARMKSVVGARGDYDVQIDQDIGQVFLKPVSGAKLTRPINLFVTDDVGRTYGLILTPEDVPAQSVLISSRNTKSVRRGQKETPYQAAIRELVRLMATNNPDAHGFEVVDHMREIPIWNEVKLTLERTWLGDDLIGERYVLMNITADEVRLAEQEFMRKGVLAVAIDKTILGPRQATGLYVVREASDGAR